MLQKIKSESFEKEKNNDFLNLLSDFSDSTIKNTGFLVKSFFNSSVKWEDILELIHENSSIDNEELSFEAKKATSNGFVNEKASGNVLIVDDLYFSVALDHNGSFFPSEIKDTLKGISSSKSHKKFVYGSSHIKVSIGSRLVPSHKDKWGAIVFQLTGKSTWNLQYPESGYNESFVVEPGDILYFPQGMFHSIKSNSARSSIIIPMEELQ